MSRHRATIVIIALLALSGCGDDQAPPASAPPSSQAPAGTTSSGPATTSSESATAESAPTGPPEIATNPDGTVNSAGPRPATSESALTAGGFGPYKIGVSQQDLKSAGLVGRITAETSENCAGYASATGTAKYHSPSLVFFKGRLLRLSVTGGGVETDQDVTIGTTLADAKKQYPGGKQVDDWTGRPAWLATTGDYGLLFETRDGKVSAMQAGMAEPMQFKYTDDQGC